MVAESTMFVECMGCGNWRWGSRVLAGGELVEW